MPHAPKRQQQDQDKSRAEKGADLAVLEQRARDAGAQLHKAYKGQGCEQHKEDRHIFRPGSKTTERLVVIGKPAGGHGGHGVHGSIERLEPCGGIGQRTSQGETHIDDRNPARDLGGAGQDFFECVKAFRPEDLHPAGTEFGQKHHGHNNDTYAAQPLQDTAPEKNALGHIVKPGQNRGSGCGQS